MKITKTITVPETMMPCRLDVALSQLFPEYSRAQWQSWIAAGAIQIDQKIATKRRQAIAPGQVIAVNATLTEHTTTTPQDIPIDVIYEDADILVINKPAGLIVHPGAGNPNGTLLNALLHRDPDCSHLPRAGIVHRLDKDTSGLLVVARNLSAHHALIKAMQARDIHREYIAIVYGNLIAGGTIDAPIGRHPTHRTKMQVNRGGRDAITHYRILKKFPHHTYLKVILETGRTHQIRVHFAEQHHPLIGDPLYGNKNLISKKWPETLQTAIANFPRQALHAIRLSLPHPKSGEQMTWEAPIPEDIEMILTALSE